MNFCLKNQIIITTYMDKPDIYEFPKEHESVQIISILYIDYCPYLYSFPGL